MMQNKNKSMLLEENGYWFSIHTHVKNFLLYVVLTRSAVTEYKDRIPEL